MTDNLSSHAHAVRVGDVVVFLNVQTDAYLLIRDAAGLINLDASRRSLTVADSDLISELHQTGLLGGPGDRPAPARQPLRPVSIGFAKAHIRLRDVLDLLIVLCAAPLHHVRPGLEPLLAYAAKPGRRGPQAETLRRAAVFASLMVWSPWQGDCLFRSHLLLRFLRAGGCDADWVFGVRVWPFAAHCWLQVDHLVLNDAAESLRPFHVILCASR